MIKYATCLLAIAACGLPDKTHCNTASDCADDNACVVGVCQPGSHDACGPNRTACAADAMCTQSSDGLACTCNSGLTGDGTSYCVPKIFTKVAAAGGFSCGLAGDGGIYCWGQNAYGDLGDGTLLPRLHPVPVGSDTDWLDVGARNNAACGLKSDHSMWCWGLGNVGQLGDGTSTSEHAPTKVVSDKPGIGWKAMALGRPTVCAVHDDGSIACWGLDRVTGTAVAAPRAVGADTDWTDLAVGTVLCGIRGAPGAPGALYCWGKSSSGDLGLGAVTSQATPTRVGTDLWKRVGVGYNVACGIRGDDALFCWGTSPFSNALRYGNTPTQVGAATDWEAISLSSTAIIGLRAGGHAYAWGNNDLGQLGVSGSTDVADPAALAGSITSWTQISSGNVHGCGISQGQAYCWGTVGEGFLGDGSSTALYSPTKIGDSRFTAAADGAGTCGLRGDGALVCWGHTFAGVGFGNTDPVWAPTRLGTDTWTSVSGSSGGVASMCAIRGGAPYCWGDNVSGQLGIGDGMPLALSPMAVHIPAATQWTEISVAAHTCAITTDRALWCWGDNGFGELGSGAAGPSVTAPSAPLAGTWLHVEAESFNLGAQTCAIRSDRTMWCWGRDQYPALTGHMVPTQVGGDASWLSLSGAWQTAPTTCAIKLDGSLWCWGVRLGDGTTSSSVVPVRVGVDNDWQSVSVGNEVCAIKTSGTLWCWGNRDALGDGTPVRFVDPTVDTSTTAPTQIGHDTDWSTAAIGGASCAIKLDGSLWCWGTSVAPVPGIATTPVPVR